MCDIMADTGYIYVNSLFNNSSLSNLNFTNVQYTFSNPNDVIIYIKTITETKTINGESHEITGNNYYLLGNNVSKTIQQQAIDIYIRGEAKGARYQNDRMDYIYFDPSMYSTENAEYSMGGSGTNGHVYTTGYKVGSSNSNYCIPISGRFNGTSFNQSLDLTLINDITTPFRIGVAGQSFTYYNYYVSRPDNKIYKSTNFFNKYSAEYYNNKDKSWWLGVGDLRQFYYVNQLYSGGTSYQGSFEPLDDYTLFDGDPLFLNIHTTHDLEKARKYLNDGTIPDDDTYVESDDGNPPIPKDSGGDSDDMDGMSNTSHTDAQSILNSPTNHYYILDSKGLKNFTNWFWNDILTNISNDYTTLGDYAFNLLTNAYGDLNKYVVSLRKLSIDIDKFFKRSTSNEIIQLGRYELAYHCDTILKDANDMSQLAEYRVPMRHANSSNNPMIGNFLDYPPYTSVSLYIPYIGIVPIDGNMVVGRTIRIFGAVDVIAGTIHYNVYVQTPKKEWSLIGSYEGKCGVDVPLALDNSMQNSTNILKGVADVTTGMCTKSMPNLLSIGNGIFSEPINNLGANTTKTTSFNPNKCALIMQSAIGTVPSNFGKVIGNLYCKSEVLGGLKGFTVCSNVRIDEFVDLIPTRQEVDEIYSLLETGVII